MTGVPDAPWNIHGDQQVRPGMLNFAVNVCQPGPPPVVLNVLEAALPQLASYPRQADYVHAQEALAALHGVSPSWVLPLAGETEAFDLLSRLPWQHVAILHPSYAGAEAPFHNAGHGDIVHYYLAEDHLPTLPHQCDLVIVGNPVNPTSYLRTRGELAQLRAPGRIVVVDEAFMDVVAPAHAAAATFLPTSPVYSHGVTSAASAPTASTQSLLGDDLIVLRSCTKTWGLAGLRVGYAVAHPALVKRLTRRRSPWTVSTLSLAVLSALPQPALQEELAAIRTRIATERDAMIRSLTKAGWRVRLPASGPFLLAQPPQYSGTVEALRLGLQERGIAVRRTDTFPLLDAGWWRLAVRDATSVQQLIEAICVLMTEEAGEETLV